MCESVFCDAFVIIHTHCSCIGIMITRFSAASAWMCTPKLQRCAGLTYADHRLGAK